VEQLKENYTKADISSAQRAMLDYAAKLTKTPGKMTEKDLVPLRKLGYGDRAILDINQITSYYAYVNRVADGLGVELEDFWNQIP
tara:strand:- start:54 stop:308 length:255 start_codon:yes stop_codon:yes gene_type:complete